MINQIINVSIIFALLQEVLLSELDGQIAGKRTV
jgi:hypothetical protein